MSMKKSTMPTIRQPDASSTSSILGEFAYLGSKSEAIIKLLAELEDRLAPILRHESTSEADDTINTDAPALRVAIRNAQAVATGIEARIASLLSRIDL